MATESKVKKLGTPNLTTKVDSSSRRTKVDTLSVPTKVNPPSKAEKVDGANRKQKQVNKPSKTEKVDGVNRKQKKVNTPNVIMVTASANAPSKTEKVDSPSSTEKANSPSRSKKVGAPSLATKVNSPSRAKKLKTPLMRTVVNPPRKTEEANAHRRKQKKVDTPRITTKVKAPSRTRKVDSEPSKTKKVVTPSLAPKVKAPSRTGEVDFELSRKIKGDVSGSATKVNASRGTKKLKTPSIPTVNALRKTEKVNAPSTTKNFKTPSKKQKVDAITRKQKKEADTRTGLHNGGQFTLSRTETGDSPSRRKEVDTPSLAKKVDAPRTSKNLKTSCKTEKVDASERKQKQKVDTSSMKTNLATKVSNASRKTGKAAALIKIKRVDKRSLTTQVNAQPSAPVVTEKKAHGPSTEKKAKKVYALRITGKKMKALSTTKICWVNPADLRFTQESISSHFKAPYEHFSIREAVEQMKAGKMSAADFPKLEVMSYGGCFWSADNRRLWIFRMAKCSKVSAKLVAKQNPRFKGVIDYPSRCRKLSNPDFLPMVKGSKTVLPLLGPAVESSDLQHTVEDVSNLKLTALEPVELAVDDLAGPTEAKERRPAIWNEDVVSLSSFFLQKIASKQILPLLLEALGNCES